jgi:hypothetical protein
VRHEAPDGAVREDRRLRRPRRENKSHPRRPLDEALRQEAERVVVVLFSSPGSEECAARRVFVWSIDDPGRRGLILAVG